MPRLIHQNPAYRHHKGSGQAVVTLGGRDHYLGPWKSSASRAEYDRLVSEWLANGRQPKQVSDLTVIELLNQYSKWATKYYANAAGNNGQIGNLRSALRIVKQLYGPTLAADFGPLALRAVQAAMIKQGWARTHVNAQVGRVRRMFKWGVARELLAGSVLHALQAVDGLRYGKSAARESSPVKPVSAPFVEAVTPFLSDTVKAMVELQQCTGMRSGEICAMRGMDLDTTAEVWTYRPAQHKNIHRGHDRVVYLGEKAKDIVRRFLKLDPTKYLFSPKDAEAARLAARADARMTPMNEGNRPGSARQRKPRKQPGERYHPSVYRRAVYEACGRAFPPAPPLGREEGETVTAWRKRLTAEHRKELRAWRRAHRWFPHQLRHSYATAAREQFGIEGAQAVLGQKTIAAAQIYAEQSSGLAQKIAKQIG